MTLTEIAPSRVERHTRRIVAGLLAAALSACGADPTPPDLSRIYAHANGVDARNPVITVPGLLGSRLIDTDSGVMIWGGGERLSADPSIPEEALAIAHPIGPPDAPLWEIRDAVRTDGVARIVRASFLGLTQPFDIYNGLIRTLIAGGYDFRETRQAEIEEREFNLDAFEFPYDWRRDVVEAAADLAYFIERKKQQVRDERIRVLGDPGPPVRFDLVGHSMGALVTRYYLMYGGADLPEDGSTPEITWAGAENVRRAVLIAPPFSGSVQALRFLVEGRSFGPLQPFYPAAALGTFPSMYQLMPRPRFARIRGADGATIADYYDPAAWERRRWGLANPEAEGFLAEIMPDIASPAERRALALAHQAKALRRAEHLHRALDQPNTPPDDLDLFLVVGGGFETPAGLRLEPDGQSFEVDRFEEGDGVVLRASSLADERQSPETTELSLLSPHVYRSILFLPEEHVRLTTDPVFGDNLLFWLLEGQRASDTLRAPARGSEGGPALGLGRPVNALVQAIPLPERDN